MSYTKQVLTLTDENRIYYAELSATMEEAKQHVDENGEIGNWGYRMRIPIVIARPKIEQRPDTT